MGDPFDQSQHAIRLDWGPIGAGAIPADVAVVVDVLSFSTAVSVAVERGTRVFPYRWRDGGAAEYAAERGAAVALGRLEADCPDRAHAASLSPARMRDVPLPDRLVLPSPNGSTIAAILADSGSTVVVGCLRNAGAVADWLAERAALGASVSVIAAGERWAADDSLRPALEDHLGAGVILEALSRLLPDHVRFSPEALTAARLARAVKEEIPALVTDCASGRELIGRGFAADVAIATECDASAVVPVLSDDMGGVGDGRLWARS